MKDKIRILLVEDEYVTALLMQKELVRMGHEVIHHSSTGEDAVGSAAQDAPDLVLMDIRLAGELDGIEAAALIRASADIPILFATGYDEKSVRERADQVGNIGFMLKPIDILHLQRIVDRHFRENPPA